MRCFALIPLLLLGIGSAVAVEAAKPDIAFLTREQAQAAIIDESVEPYFSLLQTREMTAKTGAPIDGATLAAQRDTCRKRYQAAITGFSAPEQTALAHVVAAAHAFLAAHYPVFAAEPWRFIKIAPTIEGGMPHTRGHCIVLSDADLPMFAAGDARPANPRGVMLLVHEQTHVLQRLHPELFTPLFVEAWGMVRMPAAPAPTGELLARQLVNPDGVACVWAFPVVADGVTRLVQPQVLIGGDRAVPRMPDDFEVVALDVVRHGDTYDYARGDDGRPRMAKLAEVSQYVDAFAPSEENFHPDEICAEVFSFMVAMDLVGRHVDEPPCLASLRGWAAAWLGSDRPAHHVPLPRMAMPAARPAVPPAAPTVDEMRYTVRKGDTLAMLAKRFHVGIDWLIVRNHVVDSATFTEGLEIIVPRLPAAAAP